MYTSHGHHITGTTLDENRPSKTARCGGPGLCSLCSQEVVSYTKSLTKTKKTPGGSVEHIIHITQDFLKSKHKLSDINVDVVSYACAQNKVICILTIPLTTQLILVEYATDTKVTNISEFAWINTTDI